MDHVPSEAGGTPAPQRCWIMSVARRRARAKKEATRRADMLPTYPCEGSTLPRDRLRSERPPAAVLECGEQSRAGRFMLEARARSVLMIEPSAGLNFTPTRLATPVGAQHTGRGSYAYNVTVNRYNGHITGTNHIVRHIMSLTWTLRRMRAN